MSDSFRRGVGGVGLDLAALADGSVLEVDADLRLAVTTSDGRTATAAITAGGSQVHVAVDEPDVLFAAVDPRDVGQLADLLAASGVTARVSGPDGLVATVGAEAASPLGRVSTGSRNVAPAPRAAARLALGSGLGRVVVLAAAVAVGVLAAVLLRRRGRA